MMENTIYGLSGGQYHHGEGYRDYLSSTQLKWYAASPRHYRWMLDHPEAREETDALRFGSLFHDLMAACAEHYGNGPEAIAQWLRGVAVFEPPVNERTGLPYGPATKAYREAREEFLQANEGKTIASNDELSIIDKMARSLLVGSGAASAQVCKLMEWGKPEVSHFAEYEGCLFKYRPDLETRRKIVDWKTVGTADLSEESVNRIVSKFGYDISAAFYQFFHNRLFGFYPAFYLVLVSRQPPHDFVMADMSLWAYDTDPETGIVTPGPGAVKFRALLDQHIWCVRHDRWDGASSRIMPDRRGRRIMTPQPPAYEGFRQISFFNE